MAVLFKPKEKSSSKIIDINVDCIFPNPSQPRKSFSDDEILGLAQSIKENGVLQPVSVRKIENGRYELIAGERRLRACKLVKLEYIPAIIIDATLEQSAVLAVMENIQRSDLNYFEEAEAISKLIDYYGITQEVIAKKLGKAQSTIANKLRILKLSDNIKDKVIEYNFNERQVRALLKLSEEKREAAVEYIHSHELNVAQTEEYIEHIIQPVMKKKKREWMFKAKRLYINNINRTLDTMRKSGVEFDAKKKIENGYLEYIIRIPQDNI